MKKEIDDQFCAINGALWAALLCLPFWAAVFYLGWRLWHR